MFSVKQKRDISAAVQKILRDTNHPELPTTEIYFNLRVAGAEPWSWADIKNNGAVLNPDLNPWNERQAAASVPLAAQPERKPLNMNRTEEWCMRKAAEEDGMEIGAGGEAQTPIDKTSVGLYRKFVVTRTDGSSAPGGKHADCNYFVLDLTHDVHAIPALKAYADSCRTELPLLAADLDTIAMPYQNQRPLAVPPATPEGAKEREQLIAVIDRCLDDVREAGGCVDYCEYLPAMGNFLRRVRASLSSPVGLKEKPCI